MRNWSLRRFKPSCWLLSNTSTRSTKSVRNRSSRVRRIRSRVFRSAWRRAAGQSLPVQRAGVVEQVGQVLVVDLQQAGLLQVGLGHPPAPLQVAVEPVGQHVAQGPVGGAAGRSGQLGLPGVGLPRQPQLVEHPLGQLVVSEAGRTGGDRGPVQSGPQHRHLHEVVEVGGLQRGVLAVVGERQQLAGLGAQRLRLPEAADGGQRHDGGGGGPAPGAQTGQPAEVGAPGVGVRHPAVEAETGTGPESSGP